MSQVCCNVEESLWCKHMYSDESHLSTKKKTQIDPVCDNSYPYLIPFVGCQFTPIVNPQKKMNLQGNFQSQCEPCDLTVFTDHTDFLFARSYHMAHF